jgi:hypothetical protein
MLVVNQQEIPRVNNTKKPLKVADYLEMIHNEDPPGKVIKQELKLAWITTNKATYTDL